KGKDIVPFKEINIRKVQEKAPITEMQLWRCYQIFKWRTIRKGEEEAQKQFAEELRREVMKNGEEELSGLSGGERESRVELLIRVAQTEMDMVSAKFEKHMDAASLQDEIGSSCISTKDD
ncbi:MAG: hypothetical protein EZS28_029078, partial [Streblomastix strix]